MNPQRGQPASAFVAGLDAPQLAQLLEANADEPHAGLLARTIVEQQRREPITTTTQLARTVESALKNAAGLRDKTTIDTSIRRVFQAIRIAVNDEFGALDTFLRLLPDCLKPGGRVAILTFHSGEDRRVKLAFKNGLREGVFERVADEVTRPGPEELRANPRSAPAKLRWAVRS